MFAIGWHGTYEKCTIDNVVDFTSFGVFQGAILRQAGQLALIVANQDDGIVEWVDGFDEATDEGLHRCERTVNLDGTGFGAGFDKQNFH